MMKNILCFVCLLLTVSLVFAQEPVLDRNVEEDREGAGKDRFKTQLRFGLNVGLDESPDLETEWNSFSFKFGSVALFRAAKFYSFGVSYGFQIDNFRIAQDSLNLLSLGVENDKQNLQYYTGRLGIKNRFHLGKHGTAEGVYLELGAAGSVRLTSRMRIQNELDPKLAGNQGAEEVDALYKRLQFVELFNYYGTAAIGRNGFSLYGEYRLANIFKKYEGINNNELLTDIAPLNLGIRLEL